jgi:DNA-binding transcriptional LysR family regulator
MASLRALECLVAVAEVGSITRAARLLHSSQPAVSHQLAALERETRTELLRREPRGVVLTAAGRAAIGEARRAVESAAAAVRLARAAGDASGGSLRVGCAQSLTVAVLAGVVREWHRSLPEVTVTVHESALPEELHRLLDDDEVDVLLRPGPAPERYTSVPVADEEIVVTVPEDHPLAGQDTVRLGDLEGARLVHFADDNSLRGWLDRSLAEAGVRCEVVMRTSITSAAPQLAAAGLGVAVTPVSAVAAGTAGVVRTFSPSWTRELVAVTRSEPVPLVSRFVADVRAAGVPRTQEVVRP